MSARHHSSFVSALARAQEHSPFLRDAIVRHLQVAADLMDADLQKAFSRIEPAAPGSLEFAVQLRRERSELSLILAIADLAGVASFQDTVAGLTRFADSALDRAIATAMQERTGSATPTGFAAIALGKQGGGELNFSSDIDPIFIYDPETLPRRAREDAGQAAVRIARRVIDLLQTRTADGYVLRVDLRLRPSPEVTPIALSIDAAVAYYETSALAWERAAFVRARAAAGDLALGQRFLQAVRPFVWRRSLDFGAIQEVTSISHRIREHYAEGQAFGPGYDLKRGRGGIREVEFFTQAHQLIHGGRDQALRSPMTLEALASLAKAGFVSPETADTLASAYRLLRTIEHRLQMIDDRQTHSLPSGEALDGVARLHGLDDGAALLDLLAPAIAKVADIYDALAGGSGRVRVPADGPHLLAALEKFGFGDPEIVARQITAWRRSPARALRSPAARDAFEDMLPGLLEGTAQTADPRRALHRFDDVVQRLPSGINLFRLLDARPALSGLLAQILGHAPALADQLSRRPELLDGLIASTSLDPPPPLETLIADFSRLRRPEHEATLEEVRRGVNDWRFALGTQIIARRADPIDVAGGYARVAEAAVTTLADATTASFEAMHGRVADTELLIVALGRLGGRSLTHASDIDLVYLFTGSADQSSDGPKPLRANDYYNRLARRVTAALSLPTAAGPLYDVDTRLRPSGVHGMLAVSTEAFDAYQRRDAWTFEHMALTRARCVYGSVAARHMCDTLVHDLLELPRDTERCLADAVAMRNEIARHKPPAGPVDVKRGDGGLVDLEFAVHVRQLTHRTGLHAGLGEAIADLAAAGLLPPATAEAHLLLTRLLVVLRLVSPGGEEPAAASQALVARSCGFEDWARLCEALSEARRHVAHLWTRTATQGA
ncbi:MAG TPA: bifunctional [glutamine synthetase] adenylyltransferase/[glutamine synthetase]-adenylyl-L-tyrosine phosphorylase [Sphingomonadaceae bacterium]|nr:bifunctional [glutamine synthetase] adenylyltransferase/[glutamine synthetase]-adenylyl-L-tyrosine phosphorylase [Sphingomonadaceae bacterium]